jgi:hypothetical protein
LQRPEYPIDFLQLHTQVVGYDDDGKPAIRRQRNPAMSARSLYDARHAGVQREDSGTILPSFPL